MENILKINQRLEIMLSKNVNSPKFTSRVEEITSNQVMIAMPMQKGHPILLEAGRGFYGKLFDETGVYVFKSKFLTKRMSPLPVWIITPPYDIEKTQQRSFVRFDVAQPLLIEYALENDQENLISLNVVTKDLSGGGLQAVCEKEIKIGTKVNLIITLPEQNEIQVEGEVIRIHKPQIDRPLFWTSIKFIGARDGVRDKISRFIFKKQLELRQKGYNL